MVKNGLRNIYLQTFEVSQKSSVFPLLFFVGLAIIFAGIIAIIIASLINGSETSSSTGIIIFIGPFPIVFGSGPIAPWLILIAAVVMIISIIAFILLRRSRILIK